MTSVLVEEQHQQYVIHRFYYESIFSGLIAYYELSLILYGVRVWSHWQNKRLLQNIASRSMMHIC